MTRAYARGVVAMARTPAPDSVGSQFFIVLDDEARGALEDANTYQIIGTVSDRYGRRRCDRRRGRRRAAQSIRSS